MTMYDSLAEQIRQEVGEDEWNDKEISPSVLYILSQKWGLRVPVLTQSEDYLIHREEGFSRGKHRNRSSRSS